MKLPGRIGVMLELSEGEHDALRKLADQDRVSMTVIVRDLVREHLMDEHLLGPEASFLLSKRIVSVAGEETEGEKKSPLVVHFAEKEHDRLKSESQDTGLSVTTIVRNLIREHILGISKLPT